eukprot:Protomagalhaensia_sp_Gyna_25__5984@NODE_92_length_5336_cov_75_198037_g71_i0_p4_GENE_NODE_92_length_5336_cov_75_198037_g71_i0NODE_92_length_5336_cov_75_198037_g71_i0_p4_ORF_typecomplete_len154_score13_33_NODE_92_length_5336_cov_75_198037_g71_i0228689
MLVGPAAVNNLHFGPGVNEWEVRVGFYPLSNIMQHTGSMVQEVMTKPRLRFCVTNRRHNLSEGEAAKLERNVFPLNPLLQLFLDDIEEACLQVPNPLKEANSNLGNLLPAIGQLIINVLRDAALKPSLLNRADIPNDSDTESVTELSSATAEM